MASQILPFANEIANVLTESGVLLFKGVYQAAPTETGPIISKTLIDFVALAGIVAGSIEVAELEGPKAGTCLLYTSPSPRDQRGSRMPSSA